jgi:PEP-CTERM motif
MKKLLWVLPVLLATPSALMAAPVSHVDPNENGVGFTAYVYESLADGTPSETSNIIQLPNSVVAGYVVLLESPNSDQNDVSQWSDVLRIFDFGNGLGDTMQLYSEGSPLFPSLSDVLGAAHTFIVEVQNGVGSDYVDFTTYTAGTNIYQIYSDAPVNENETTPEPASLVLASMGFVGLAAYKWRRRKQSA